MWKWRLVLPNSFVQHGPPLPAYVLGARARAIVPGRFRRTARREKGIDENGDEHFPPGRRTMAARRDVRTAVVVVAPETMGRHDDGDRHRRGIARSLSFIRVKIARTGGVTADDNSRVRDGPRQYPRHRRGPFVTPCRRFDRETSSSSSSS